MDRQLIKHLITGGILILAGLLFLVDEFDWIHAVNILQFWPFLFVIFGIVKIVSARHPNEWIKGSWQIFIGLWLYVSLQHIFGLSFAVTWPFILIFWGLTIVVKELLPVFTEQKQEGDCCGQ